MRPLTLTLLLTLSGALIAGCMDRPMHQGNVLEPQRVMQISEGDTKFRVEMLLGTPILRDELHPGRALYVEDYHDPDTGERYRRGIEIYYDRTLRVKRLRRFGFK